MGVHAGTTTWGHFHMYACTEGPGSFGTGVRDPETIGA